MIKIYLNLLIIFYEYFADYCEYQRRTEIRKQEVGLGGERDLREADRREWTGQGEGEGGG